MGEQAWRLMITPPQPGGSQNALEAAIGEWAHVSHATPPAVEAAPGAGYGGWDAYTVTVPGDSGDPPKWLKSLDLYLWGKGYMGRLRKTSGR